MPGSGKSYYANKLGTKFNLPVLELDDMIERSYNMSLYEILDKYGDSGLKELETKELTKIDFTKTGQIISTGGSVIYSDEGMNHLQNSNNLIIFLDEDFDILMDRTNNFTNRGIIFNGLTPYQLYAERYPLYEKYSDIKITPPMDLLFNILVYSKLLD